MLHWAAGAGGRGALLTGDIIQVVPDRKHVSFMYSYPNYVPLPASAVERVVRAVGPFEYDRVYGAFWGMVIDRDGKAVVKRSAERYLRAIGDWRNQAPSTERRSCPRRKPPLPSDRAWEGHRGASGAAGRRSAVNDDKPERSGSDSR